jgi:hypothetical protein
MTNIKPSSESARESSRRTDGKFGEQEKSESAVTLTGVDADEMRIDDWQRKEIVRQIGGNLMAISGGRVKALPDGIEMPVSNGYKVRVRLSSNDTYRVERVFSRGGTDFDKGFRDNVYADQVSEHAYYASCFRNDGGNWTYMG